MLKEHSFNFYRCIMQWKILFFTIYAHFSNYCLGEGKEDESIFFLFKHIISYTNPSILLNESSGVEEVFRDS